MWIKNIIHVLGVGNVPSWKPPSIKNHKNILSCKIIQAAVIGKSLTFYSPMMKILKRYHLTATSYNRKINAVRKLNFANSL